MRHGHEDGEVTLGGRRIEVKPAAGPDRGRSGRSRVCPRAATVARRSRSASRSKAAARSTSKSAVSRTFVDRTRHALGELMARQLLDLRLAVMMIDGIDLSCRTNIFALGITTEGVKIPLALWEGSSENATVATALLSDLVERGLDPEQGMLFVIDGSKALRKAIRSVFGEVPVHRCIRH